MKVLQEHSTRKNQEWKVIGHEKTGEVLLSVDSKRKAVTLLSSI